MKADLLVKKLVSRSGPDGFSYQLKRGRLSSILLTNTMSWHHADRITIKLRHPAGNITVVDRISAITLLSICDLKQGKPTIGTNLGIASDDYNAGHQIQHPEFIYTANAFNIYLGHLTLDNCELEVIVETAAQPVTYLEGVAQAPNTGLIKIVSIEDAVRADTLFTYDVNSDLEATSHQVREIYLVAPAAGSFFTQDPDTKNIVGKDVFVRLNVDETSYECDVEVLGALTAIMGELTEAPSGLLRVFQDAGSIGSTVAAKVFGDDAAGTTLLYVREVVVPGMAQNSVYSALGIEQRKVEKLELREPEQAAALQQLGKISTSATLARAKDQVPQPSAY